MKSIAVVNMNRESLSIFICSVSYFQLSSANWDVAHDLATQTHVDAIF